MGQAPVRKKKKGCGPVLLAIIIILAVLVGAGGWYTMGLRAVEPGSEEEVVLDIPNGSGASMIMEILDEAGLVRNKICAKINAKIAYLRHISNLIHFKSSWMHTASI